MTAQDDNLPRKRGPVIGVGQPGPLNAITDVEGVSVGHATLNFGEGELKTGVGPVRTGVTVVVPHPAIWREPLCAGIERINGNGEMTGAEWVRESGLLTTPIAITNTHSVGVVRDALAAIHMRANPTDQTFSLPVVAETYDGYLNDINGHHVNSTHVRLALRNAATASVMEGAVGGGTGMVCHGFKGGIGTASRVVRGYDGVVWTVGVLVQANHGVRERLVIDGVPIGRLIGPKEIPLPSTASAASGTGSIIFVVATDAPLLPHQCAAVAKRTAFGLARTGGAGERSSGDFAIAFSTANRIPPEQSAPIATLKAITGNWITPIYYATVEATEQAILNALVAARTMVGANGHTAHALPIARLESMLDRRDLKN